MRQIHLSQPREGPLARWRRNALPVPTNPPHPPHLSRRTTQVVVEFKRVCRKAVDAGLQGQSYPCSHQSTCSHLPLRRPTRLLRRPWAREESPLLCVMPGDSETLQQRPTAAPALVREVADSRDLLTLTLPLTLTLTLALSRRAAPLQR